ncbi:protein DsbE [Enterobacter kobei]|uniref:hypothetical protein n=1 Tax=Enterobacter kobei TaxID=208224 RepID=UPI0007968A57|nr:hypothetical protein [Enterobacter kobei]CZX29957.1 protein DsbE [Enterobacter kobei]
MDNRKLSRLRRWAREGIIFFLLALAVMWVWGGDRFCMVVMWGKKGAEAMNDGGCEAR